MGGIIAVILMAVWMMGVALWALVVIWLFGVAFSLIRASWPSIKEHFKKHPMGWG